MNIARLNQLTSGEIIGYPCYNALEAAATETIIIHRGDIPFEIEEVTSPSGRKGFIFYIKPKTVNQAYWIGVELSHHRDNSNKEVVYAEIISEHKEALDNWKKKFLKVICPDLIEAAVNMAPIKELEELRAQLNKELKNVPVSSSAFASKASQLKAVDLFMMDLKWPDKAGKTQLLADLTKWPYELPAYMLPYQGINLFKKTVFE